MDTDRALQACMKGSQAVIMVKVVGEIDICTDATGNFNIIILVHMEHLLSRQRDRYGRR